MDTTITYDDHLDSLVEEASPLDSDTTPIKRAGETAKKKQLNISEKLANGFNNLLIDGDFNHWQSGKTTTTTTLEYLSDVWTAKGTIGDWDKASHSTDNSKDFYLSYTGSASYTNAQLRQLIKGNPFSGKTLTIFARLKSPSASPTALSCIILSDGTVIRATSNTVSSITTGWDWYRFDVVVPAFAVTAYTEFKFTNSATETFNLDVDKVRVIETPENLPDDVTPEWVKQDENPLVTSLLVKAYYQKIVGDTPLMPAMGRGASADTTDQAICTGVEMVKIPTVSVTSVTTVLNITAGANVTLSGGETYTAERLSGIYVNFRITDTGLFIASNVYGILLTNSSDYLELDARY